MGLKPPQTDDDSVTPLSSVSSIFKKFATDIDANTIKLGIDKIDADVRVTTSMLVGLVSPPGGGKTTTAFEIMNNASNAGTKTMFFSMDMGAPLVFQRLIQKHTSHSSKKIFDMYKNDDKELVEIENKLAKEYSNVSFCFKSGLTVEEIKDMIIREQEKVDTKIKLVVIDYLECISSAFSDSTASGAYITQKLKDLANELELTVLLLLQPPKVAGDPSDELLSYTKIKGSSVIQQACSVIFSMWRPGFSPKNPGDDRFVCFAVLKNRMGSLGQYEFSWDGLTGNITEMDEMEQIELNKIRERKAREKAAIQGDI
jgi:replicative DNA helicase